MNILMEGRTSFVIAHRLSTKRNADLILVMQDGDIQPDGENRFLIALRPGGNFTFARGSYQSIYGKIESGGIIEKGKIIYEVHVPENCAARMVLSGKEPFTVQTGDYKFKVKEVVSNEYFMLYPNHLDHIDTSETFAKSVDK